MRRTSLGTLVRLMVFAVLLSPATPASATVIALTPADLSGASLITFDGLTDGTVVNGLSVGGVQFNYLVNNLPSTDARLDGGPGITNNISPLNIVNFTGNANAILRLTFPEAEVRLGYGFAIHSQRPRSECDDRLPVRRVERAGRNALGQRDTRSLFLRGLSRPGEHGPVRACGPDVQHGGPGVCGRQLPLCRVRGAGARERGVVWRRHPLRVRAAAAKTIGSDRTQSEARKGRAVPTSCLLSVLRARWYNHALHDCDWLRTYRRHARVRRRAAPGDRCGPGHSTLRL